MNHYQDEYDRQRNILMENRDANQTVGESDVGVSDG